MSNTSTTSDEITEVGEAVYEKQIKALVEPQFNGQFIAIDVGSGRYEMGDRVATALQRAQSKFGDMPFYIKRIGYQVAFRIGINCSPECK